MRVDLVEPDTARQRSSFGIPKHRLVSHPTRSVQFRFFCKNEQFNWGKSLEIQEILKNSLIFWNWNFFRKTLFKTCCFDATRIFWILEEWITFLETSQIRSVFYNFRENFKISRNQKFFFETCYLSLLELTQVLFLVTIHSEILNVVVLDLLFDLFHSSSITRFKVRSDKVRYPQIGRLPFYREFPAKIEDFWGRSGGILYFSKIIARQKKNLFQIFKFKIFFVFPNLFQIFWTHEVWWSE